MKAKKGNLGFSLVELMVALPVVVILLWAMLTLSEDLFRKSGLVGTEVQLKNQFNTIMNYVMAEMQSAVSLAPAENLYVTGPEYLGVAGIDSRVPKLATSACRNDRDANGTEKFSIIRHTSISRALEVEKLLRPWNELDIDDLNKPLRLSYHANSASTSYPFQTSGGSVALFPELYLIDADLFAYRRYRVISATHVVTNLDPYDDQVKLLANGTQDTFTYTQVQLGMPYNYEHVTQTKSALNFITGSMAYAANTKRTCVSPQNKLIELNETTGETRELFDPSDFQFKFDKFQITYYGSKTSSTIDRTAFIEYPLTSPQNVCMNLVNFRVQFSRAAAGGIPASTIAVDRMALIRNFNNKRAMSCL